MAYRKEKQEYTSDGWYTQGESRAEATL